MATPSPTPTRQQQTDPVPLALWPVAQRTAQWQRAGRYHPGCADHPGKMLPELARRIVAEYSAPGNLVIDVMAGTGTTLIEAADLGRRAIGIELEARWVDLARDNADYVLGPEARRLVDIRQGDATDLVELLGTDAGRVDLIATSPPYICDTGVIDKSGWLSGRSLCSPEGFNYSADRAHLGYARGAAYEAAMAKIYAACFAVLRPGGILAVVTKNTRRKGRTFDLAGLTVALAERAGFTYLGHVIALHAAIRHGDLAGRPSYWQTIHLGRARERGEPVHLVAHEDVIVLARPPKCSGSGISEVADAH